METDFLTNQQLHKQLQDVVVDRLAEHGVHGQVKNDLPLQINYFSICFRLEIEADSKSFKYYVKIPKANLLLMDENNILPLTKDDRRMAEEEYRSLCILAQDWNSEDINIKFVKPVDFLPNYNAIVTEYVPSRDYFIPFRHADLSGQLLRRGRKDNIHQSLGQLGEALSRFHQSEQVEGHCETEQILKKIYYYGRELKTLGADPAFLDTRTQQLSRYQDDEISVCRSRTLKGLDIRNILEGENGGLFILDPGKIKLDYQEADLARFLVTCKILYWGSLGLLWPMVPDISYEESFIRGYYGKRPMKTKLLSLLTTKELFKHWYMAYVVLRLKPWPQGLKRIIKKVYIDRFYKNQLSIEANRT